MRSHPIGVSPRARAAGNARADPQPRPPRRTRMRTSSRRRRLPLLAVSLSVAALVTFGGATGGVAAATTKHHPHKPAHKFLELGGTWSGNYHGGKFSGSFTLNW